MVRSTFTPLVALAALITTTACSDMTAPARSTARSARAHTAIPDAPSIVVTGGLTAGATSCEGLCTPPAPAIISIQASGTVITIKDNSGHTGSMVFTNTTVSGGLTASTSCSGLCTPPPAVITSVTGKDTDKITITDNGGHTGTITLSAPTATATGGLAAKSSCAGLCTPPQPVITSMQADPDGFRIDFADRNGDTGQMSLFP